MRLTPTCMFVISVTASSLVIFGPATALASERWVQADLRGLEFAPPPANEPSPCARLWIEERQWTIEETPSALVGIYGNVVRSQPLGTTTDVCQFQSAPAKLSVFSIRTWNISSANRDGHAWLVRAEPNDKRGDPLGLPHEPFSTKLWLSENGLVDSFLGLEAPDHLEFRRPGGVPPDLNAAARDVLEGLYSGKCAQIMSDAIDASLPVERSSQMVAAICELRRRMTSIGGNLVSVSIGDITRFDRAAAAVVDRRDAQGWDDRTIYLVEFTTNLERQRIPGDALFAREAGRWKLVRLWF